MTSNYCSVVTQCSVPRFSRNCTQEYIHYFRIFCVHLCEYTTALSSKKSNGHFLLGGGVRNFFQKLSGSCMKNNVERHWFTRWPYSCLKNPKHIFNDLCKGIRHNVTVTCRNHEKPSRMTGIQTRMKRLCLILNLTDAWLALYDSIAWKKTDKNWIIWIVLLHSSCAMPFIERKVSV